MLVRGEKVVYETKLHWVIYISLRAVFTLWLAPFIRRITSEFVITNRRVIIKVGFIRRKTLEMNLEKIESVKVDQGIMARILGYGTVTIIGTGGTRESFPTIKRALRFRKVFQEYSTLSEMN